MIDVITDTISTLKIERPIFHSEDDFKFAFAEHLLKRLGSDFSIRLERPQIIKMIKRNGQEEEARAPIDIVIKNNLNNISYPIELKYKTKKLTTSLDGEMYNLTDHGAIDIGRFSFRKDIFRIEQLLETATIPEGFFIVITNDAHYLKDVTDKDTLDKAFSFHHGSILEKDDKGWNYKKILHKGFEINEENQLVQKGKIHWTSKGDSFYQLNLKNAYKVEWSNYSKIENDFFHIAIIKIE